MRCLKCGLVGDGMGQATGRDLLTSEVGREQSSKDEVIRQVQKMKLLAVTNVECRMSRVRGRRLTLDVLRLGMPAGHLRSRHEYG